MTEKANLVVSFAALLSAWMVGFAVARFFGWEFSTLYYNPASPFELIWMGFACLVLGSLFFGRLGFLFFFMLGAIQSTGVPYPGMVPLFFQTMVLVWFGMVGNSIGEELYDDLRARREFDALEKKRLWLFAIGIVFALVISLLSPVLDSLGEKLVNFARKVRNKEFTLDNILDFFGPVDANNTGNQNGPGS